MRGGTQGGDGSYLGRWQQGPAGSGGRGIKGCHRRGWGAVGTTHPSPGLSPPRGWRQRRSCAPKIAAAPGGLFRQPGGCPGEKGCQVRGVGARLGSGLTSPPPSMTPQWDSTPSPVVPSCPQFGGLTFSLLSFSVSCSMVRKMRSTSRRGAGGSGEPSVGLGRVGASCGDPRGGLGGGAGSGAVGWGGPVGILT